MRANPLVPWGGSVQRSGGETSEPSQVYLGGISPPGPNAGLRSLKALTDTPRPYDDVSRFSRLERAGAVPPSSRSAGRRVRSLKHIRPSQARGAAAGTSPNSYDSEYTPPQPTHLPAGS